MAFVEDAIIEILNDAAGLVTLAYDVKHVGHNRYKIDDTYDPEKDEFLGMDDETRANARVAYSMFAVIPPQISIQTV